MHINADLKLIIKKPSLMLDAILNYRRNLADLSALKETFIRQDYQCLINDAPDNAVVLDLGGYIGDTAIYFARSDKVRKVYSYEPSPNSYKRGIENVRDCPYHKKIEYINAAGGQVAKSIKISESLSGISFEDIQKKTDAKGITIQVKTLNQILDEIGRDNIVLIKCDTDGSECDIFRNADLSNVNRVMLEFHNTKKDMEKILKEKGFKTLVTQEHKGLYYEQIGCLFGWRD